RMWITLRKFRQIDFFDKRRGALVCFTPREPSARGQSEHDVVFHCLPWEKLVELLKHEHSIWPGRLDRLAIEQHVALDRFQIAANGFQDGCLSAPCRSKNDETIAPPDIEAHAISRRERLPAVVVFKRDAVDRKQAHQLPGASWTSGKKKSFHEAGRFLMEPTLYMKSAYFMTFSGVVVNFTLASFRNDTISSREKPPSGVDARRVSAASCLSSVMASIASSRAFNTAA